jgi:HSP20 family protein
MLLRFDPFRELDRITEGRMPRSSALLPMDAYRRGNHVIAHIDLPGVPADGVEIEVERNVLTVTATRSVDRTEGDEIIVGERPHGEFRRQLFLGETLDPNRVEAEVTDGVLTLRIPVAETAKPRRITVGTGGSSGGAIEASSSEADSSHGGEVASGAA